MMYSELTPGTPIGPKAAVCQADPATCVESRGALHWRGSDEEAAGLAGLRVEGKGGRRASGDCSPTLVSAACSTGTPGRRVTSRECSSRPRKWRRRAETSVSLAAVVGRAPFLRVRAGAGFTGHAAGGRLASA